MEVPQGNNTKRKRYNVSYYRQELCHKVLRNPEQHFKHDLDGTDTKAGIKWDCKGSLSKMEECINRV